MVSASGFHIPTAALNVCRRYAAPPTGHTGTGAYILTAALLFAWPAARGKSRTKKAPAPSPPGILPSCCMACAILLSCFPYIGLEQPVVAQPSLIVPRRLQRLDHGLHMGVRVVREIQRYRLQKRRFFGRTVFQLSMV